MAVSQERYSTVAILLHWAIALLILTNIGVAWYFNTLKGAVALPYMTFHKSVGITVLLLSVIRVGWRLAVPVPPSPAGMAPWEVFLSKVTHVLFYVIMLGLPLTGWAMSSARANAAPITLFNLIPWPLIEPLTRLPTDQIKAAHEVFQAGHGLLAKLTYVLVLLHVAAALKHQFINRDNLLARMSPHPARRAG